MYLFIKLFLNKMKLSDSNDGNCNYKTCQNHCNNYI